MKKKVLLSSILTIAVCLSLIAGSTFALFTADDTVDITMKGARVNLTTIIAENTLELYSIGDYMGDGVTTFENGGYATILDNVTAEGKTPTLQLTNITPGDEVRFDIQMFNDSNVHIVYRVQYSVQDRTGSKLYAFGDTIWQEWKIPATAEEKYRTSPVSVLFDVTADNTYQEKDLKVVFTVEAYQANADVYDALMTTSNAAEVQQALASPDGGVVDGGKKEIQITANDGGLGLMHNKPVTLQNVTLNAERGSIAAVVGNCCGELVLGTGAEINAADGTIGVFYLYNNHALTLEYGSKINASGAGAACIRMDSPSGNVAINFKGSDLLNPTNGATGIYLTCGNGTYSLYFESEADMAAYTAMIVEEDVYEGTNTFVCYVNGVEVYRGNTPVPQP